METQEQLILDSIQSTPWQADAYFQQHPVDCLLCLPLCYETELLGILYLENYPTEPKFHRERLNLIQQLADQLSLSLYQTEYIQQLQPRQPPPKPTAAEQALQESEERFRQLAENIEEVFWVVDAHTQTILYVSPAYEKIWGRSCEELYQSSQCWLDSIHPEDRQRVKDNLEQRYQKGYDVQYRIVQPHGELRWIRDRTFPILDETGQVYRTVGIAEDMTQRQQLEQNQKRLVAILEASPDYVLISNPQGQILWLNTQAKQLYGLSGLEDVSLLEISDCYPQWALHQILNHGIPQAIKQGVWIGETAVLNTTGAEIPVSQVIIAHRNGDGEVENFSFIARNINQLKQAERALRQVNSELENRVESRTAELKVAKEAADVANRAKSEFLANMSHELRTPLNGILGYAQILQRSLTLTPEEQQGIQVIYQCGSHLLTLINDILDLSKIEACKMQLYPQPFNFKSFLHGVVEICSIKAQQKGIQFLYHPSLNLPSSVIADEKRLRQVLLNLITNSIKFTHTGSIDFKVEQLFYQPEENKMLLKFQVKDTGIGIEPSQLKKIFLPFEQVGELARQQEGTGLGLAITQKILQLMGSQIQVESVPEQGSVFSFELLLNCELEDLVNFQPETEMQIVGYTEEAKTILIVDDSPENLFVLRDLLQPLGFKLMEASQGKAALKQALLNKPDLVITDVIMPEMDGLEFTQKLRSDSELNSIAIIATSASISEVDQQKSLEAGCNYFLPKPIQAQELYRTISQLLSIEWKYKYPQKPAESIQKPQMIVPPLAELYELKQLIQKGRIIQIKAAAEKLKQLDLQYYDFAQKVIHLAQDFEIEQLNHLLNG
jgi:PAS domain S-box-containing protein